MTQRFEWRVEKNSHTFSKVESYEIPELPNHIFETENITCVEVDGEYGPMVKHITVIKHILPCGKLDLKHLKMHIFVLFGPNVYGQENE